MVNPGSYIPQRGDLVWLTFQPQEGHEQTGRRPALVLSPSAYNGRVGLALFCPVTSRVKGYPFEVLVPENISVSGAILADQVKCLDWRTRNAEFICILPDRAIGEVLAKLGTLLA